MERSAWSAEYEGVSGARPYGSSLRAMLSNSALAALCVLLGSYTPFEGVSPFGTAGVMAAWFIGLDPYFACAGALVGYLLSGSYIYAGAVVILGGCIFIANLKTKLARVYRLLLAYGVQTAALLLLGVATRQSLAILAGASTVSVLAAVVTASGLRAFLRIPGGRRLNDTELLTLSALSGIVTLAMRNFSILGVSPAIVFAGACALFASYRFGIPAVAFAVTVGAGRVLGVGSDMRFIAVLAAGTLLAASLRSLGKWASLIGFGAAELIITASMRGTGLFGYVEILLILVIFAIVPERLYVADSVRHEAAGEPVTDGRYSRLQYRVASLSDVLSELARVYGGDNGRMLSCIAGTLRRSLNGGSAPRPTFTTEYGTASGTKDGSVSSGDSVTAASVEGKLLIALSDGMGSGNEASGESRSALALLKDLLTVGFGVDEAVDCVNRLLSSRGQGDMYTTLDVLLIDLTDGIARLSKHGAPSSFILRGGKVFTLYSEALPIGIIEDARGTVRSVRLKSGDTVIMMTDGVPDALGHELIAAITDNVLSFGDAEMAAHALLDAAQKNGREDDMTVAVVRIEETVG